VQSQPRRDVIVLLLGPRTLGPECSTSVALDLFLEILKRVCLEVFLRAALARRLMVWPATVFRAEPDFVEPPIFERLQSRLLVVVLVDKKRPLRGLEDDCCRMFRSGQPADFPDMWTDSPCSRWVATCSLSTIERDSISRTSTQARSALPRSSSV
jgi:hypothetical protein